MKQKKIKKNVTALLLAVAMIVTSFPQVTKEVHAAELPTATQFATVAELKKFDTYDTNSNGRNPAKVYFGNNNQQWWIAGSQGNESLVLFAASPLVAGQPFELNWTENKTYREAWNCDYTSNGGTNPTEVLPNHYGASPLRTTLQDLETSCFTSEEQKLMNTTTVYTNDTKNSNSAYSTTDKLYLAYSAGYGDSYRYVMVGRNSASVLGDGLRIDKSYWGNKGFWLRAPAPYYDLSALVAWPGGCVDYILVRNPYAVVPAFELNLSSLPLLRRQQQETEDSFQ